MACTTASDMIDVSYLTKKYGSLTALSMVSFTAEHGTVLGLLGPNGAGKSSIMSIIAGYTQKSSGRVHVCGFDIDTHRVDAKLHIGYLPEHSPLPVNMTVEEFLEFSSDLKKIRRQDVKSGIEQAVEITGLTDVRHRLIRNISKGYRQRVGIAQALLGSPEVLILDEPTSGLDPLQLVEMRSLIRKLGETHTILFSSHILSEAESICDRVIVLYKGRIIADDSPSALIASIPENRFQLSSTATHEQIAAALSSAGIGFSELEPLGKRLEDTFLQLIIGAEHEAGL